MRQRKYRVQVVNLLPPANLIDPVVSEFSVDSWRIDGAFIVFIRDYGDSATYTICAAVPGTLVYEITERENEG